MKIGPVKIKKERFVHRIIIYIFGYYVYQCDNIKCGL